MTAFLWDEGLRPGILDALHRMVESAPELIAGVRDRLEELDDTNDTGEQVVLNRLLAVNREGADGE